MLKQKEKGIQESNKNGSRGGLVKLQKITGEAKIQIEKAKDKYFNKTLPDTLRSDPEKFWRVLNPK